MPNKRYCRLQPRSIARIRAENLTKSAGFAISPPTRLLRRGGRVVDRGGLENRWRCKPSGGSNPSPSATCPSESVLPIWLWPDFSVVFEGYARSPFHRSRHAVTPKRSLRASILRGSALRAIWCRAVRTCYPCVFASVRTSHSAKPSAHDATLASEKAAFELVSRWTWFIDQPVLARQHLRAW